MLHDLFQAFTEARLVVVSFKVASGFLEFLKPGFGVGHGDCLSRAVAVVFRERRGITVTRAITPNYLRTSVNGVNCNKG